jgi:hypothetical protein
LVASEPVERHPWMHAWQDYGDSYPLMYEEWLKSTGGAPQR